MPPAQASPRASSPWRKTGLLPNPASASTQEKRRPASRTRSISASAISGLLCAVRAAAGTPAASQRFGSSVQAAGRNKPQPNRQRHLAARQGQRDQHLTVRHLAQFAAVLPRYPDRERALLGQAR